MKQIKSCVSSLFIVECYYCHHHKALLRNYIKIRCQLLRDTFASISPSFLLFYIFIRILFYFFKYIKNNFLNGEGRIYFSLHARFEHVAHKIFMGEWNDAISALVVQERSIERDEKHRRISVGMQDRTT